MLPKIYFTHRRAGKTTQLRKIYDDLVKKGEEAIIIIMNWEMRKSPIWEGVPRNRFLVSSSANERLRGTEVIKNILVDDWDMVPTAAQRSIAICALNGVNVVGFASVDFCEPMSFDQHFNLNPNMTDKDLEEYTRMR